MQGPGQGADGPGNDMIGVGQGRTGYQYRKGAGIDRVFGMENQADVENAGQLRIGLLTAEHIEEIGGIDQIRVGGIGSLP